ncbi:MBL fold metallo-hydrolase [Paludibacter jiangxiensis]|uniref:Phosphoribosyl 1,2-cyclic phosphate phosphodiesterase n=1 Tax=Paludibacter jiangxiensis TaxID=681398 RepID=A0A170Y968_9BACT|nr:MBL fold metallo-hydrolase [Paludibacter jiangxiensis]GAT61613.1 phosphoribosyl 1,2-cyclic phosphate phosphodiesterase [Paludibacter jiangxiensis]
MEILFLGTGTSNGVPQLCCNCDTCASTDTRDKRLRASALISVNGKNILIDCGPDFRQQMLTHHITSLSAILLTHEHYDHVAGLDDVRSYRAVDVFAEERVNRALMKTMHYSFSANKYPGTPELKLHEISEYIPFEAAGVEVTPLRAMHAQLPILGFRIGNMAYVTDFKTLPEKTLDQLTGLDLLVMGTLRFKPHFSHLMVDESLTLINRLTPKQTYFTHMSHDMGLHELAEKELPPNVRLAYDGLKIKL